MLLLVGLRFLVLIESDWNLKSFVTFTPEYRSVRINRIRLEFKVECS